MRKSLESLNFFTSQERGCQKIQGNSYVSAFFEDLADKCISLHGLRLGELLGEQERLGSFRGASPFGKGMLAAESFFLILLLKRRISVSSCCFGLLLRVTVVVGWFESLPFLVVLFRSRPRFLLACVFLCLCQVSC